MLFGAMAASVVMAEIPETKNGIKQIHFDADLTKDRPLQIGQR